MTFGTTAESAPTGVRSAAVPAATTRWVASSLAHPPREVRVLHAGDHAAYVDDGDSCIGVLSRRANSVPCGLVTSLDDLRRFDLRAGDLARLGGGQLVFAAGAVKPSRIVDASVPRLAKLPDIDVHEPRIAAAADELDPGALERLAEGDPDAVRSLLGRGSGLTPLGDDVLCGWLAGRNALGRSTEPVAAEVTRRSMAGTTRLSSTLLTCAIRGDVVPQVRVLLRGTGTLDALLSIGHTSGAGLALGLALAGDSA
jgi:hypothetical protein